MKNRQVIAIIALTASIIFATAALADICVCSDTNRCSLEHDSLTKCRVWCGGDIYNGQLKTTGSCNVTWSNT